MTLSKADERQKMDDYAMSPVFVRSFYLSLSLFIVIIHLCIVLVMQPAQIAGCKTVVVATPPRPDGSICPVSRPLAPYSLKRKTSFLNGDFKAVRVWWTKRCWALNIKLGYVRV